MSIIILLLFAPFSFAPFSFAMNNYHLVVTSIIILAKAVYGTDVENSYRLVKPEYNISGVILDELTVVSKVECGER